MKRFARFVFNFINDGGWRCVLILGGIGITLSVIAMYGKCGFNWIRFIFADVPLFAFCGWALYSVYKLIKNNKDVFK